MTETTLIQHFIHTQKRDPYYLAEPITSVIPTTIGATIVISHMLYGQEIARMVKPYREPKQYYIAELTEQ